MLSGWQPGITKAAGILKRKVNTTDKEQTDTHKQKNKKQNKNNNKKKQEQNVYLFGKMDHG